MGTQHYSPRGQGEAPRVDSVGDCRGVPVFTSGRPTAGPTRNFQRVGSEVITISLYS
eukprot:m.475866 g.475866  ORF g.475866 m.475866 type:complete len:57 (+) comp39272_c0_seq1:1100-1270(+)